MDKSRPSSSPVQHFYRDVKDLGHVSVSRKVQAKLQSGEISEGLFRKVLLEPLVPDVPDGHSAVWRERDGLRLVIVTRPDADSGAAVVVTAYRTNTQARAWIRK